MRTSIHLILYTILALPSVASAQTISELMQEVLADKQGYYADVVQGSVGSQVAPQPVAPIVPVVPVVPLYPPNAIPNNPYGTGYSVVTTERVQPDYVQQYLGVKGAVSHTTVTSVVPNNAWGAPMRPPLFLGYP